MAMPPFVVPKAAGAMAVATAAAVAKSALTRARIPQERKTEILMYHSSTTDMTQSTTKPSREFLLHALWVHGWTLPRQQKTWRFEKAVHSPGEQRPIYRTGLLDWHEESSMPFPVFRSTALQSPFSALIAGNLVL